MIENEKGDKKLIISKRNGCLFAASDLEDEVRRLEDHHNRRAEVEEADVVPLLQIETLETLSFQ